MNNWCASFSEIVILMLEVNHEPPNIQTRTILKMVFKKCTRLVYECFAQIGLSMQTLIRYHSEWLCLYVEQDAMYSDYVFEWVFLTASLTVHNQ
jgi:hypothetical protein